MKKLLLIAIIISSCNAENKIAVQFNKYGPLHRVRYTSKDGKYYVQGKEVHLLPGTKVYCSK